MSKKLLFPVFCCVCLLTMTSSSGRNAGPAFRWPEGKRAAISLSFDDARRSQVDVGLPLLSRYGVRATFYVSPSNMKDRLEGWKKAVADGHEIGNHSLTHPCSVNFDWSRQNAIEDMSLEQMRREIGEANVVIKDQLRVAPKTFAYPCGQKFTGRGRNLKSTVPLVSEMFAAGRGFMDESTNDPVLCDMAQLMGKSSDNRPFDQIRPSVDQAIASGAWLVLAGHEIGLGDRPQTTQVAMLEDLFKYAQDPARGLWIDTVQNVAAYIEKQRGASSSAGVPSRGGKH